MITFFFFPKGTFDNVFSKTNWKMNKSKAQQLFILGLGLMLLFRILANIPFIPEDVAGFDTAKLLKIIIGLSFILISFLIYRKSNQPNL